jgi:hypothetical protein
MTRAILVALCLGLLTATGVGAGFTRDMDEYPAIRESLEHVSRKQWASWLERHGLDATRYTTYQRTETTGLRLVGKYGRGPSVEVMAQDTLMALTLGSECALLNIANPDQPRVLNEIQLDYLPHQSLLSGSLLLTGGNGIQIWNITDPSQPVQLSEIPYAIGDFSIVDTFLYFVGNDTFFAYSFANPASPHRIGFCVDSGYVTAATGNTAVLIQPNDVLGFVDVSDPAHPQQVGIWPAWPLSAVARGNLCCAAFSDPSNQDLSWFLTLDISDPANPRQLARLDTVCGYDIYLTDSLAFVSGRSDSYEEMRIVSITDSTHPRKLGTCYVWNDNWGVWADPSHNRAYIASEPSGLAVVDITDPSVPHVDTCVMTADQAEDIWIDGDRAYVADYRAGLKILDISNPSSPRELGGSDSVHTFCETAVAVDSFAFASWPQPPLFRSFLVSDPTRPLLVGGFDPETDPKDMVVRDTFVYLAGRFRFNVVNVAKPREPVLVGSCGLNATGRNVALRDTVAYVALGSSGLVCIDVSSPEAPVVIGSWGGRSSGVSLADTIAYVAGPYTGLVSLNVSDPSSPRVIDSLYLGDTLWWNDVTTTGSRAYVGGERVLTVDITDPANLMVRGSLSPPYLVQRVAYSSPYLYAACLEAGVAIYETTAVGIAEQAPARHRPAALRLRPGLTDGEVHFTLDVAARSIDIAVYDVSGKRLGNVRQQVTVKGGAAEGVIDLSGLAAGVYVVRVEAERKSFTAKVVKTNRR